MLFSLVEIQLRFTESYCLHLQGQNIRQANSQQEACGKQSEQHVKNGVQIWAVEVLRAEQQEQKEADTGK
jgi:hypothetical protein